MRLFVTGSLGFIGSHLIPELRAQGHDIIGFDRQAPPRDLPYRSFRGDVAEQAAVAEALPAGTDVLVHLAAEHKDEGVLERDYFRVNGQGTANLLAEATRKGVRRFLFFSSVAVYGDTPGAAEETIPRPTTPYGRSKVEAERCVREWAVADTRNRAVILRPTAVYGPGNRANIYRLMKQVHDGHFIMVGSGENVKSVAFVRNLVSATCYMLARMEPGPASGGSELVNYVDYPQLPIRDLVTLVARCSGRSLPRWRIPVGLAEFGAGLLGVGARLSGRAPLISPHRVRKFVTTSWFHADRIRDLGFQQPFTTEQGLRETIRIDCRNGRADNAA